MKLKDKKEIFDKNAKELVKLLSQKKDELFNLKIDHSQNKLKNTTSLFAKRKEIAMLLTALKEKEYAENQQVKEADSKAK